MRKFLITLLLASAAASPALADPNKSDHQQAREDRQQAREDRQQARDTAREDRSAERPQLTPHFDKQPQPQPQPQSFSGAQNYQPNARANMDAYRAERAARDSFAGQRDERLMQRQQDMRDRADLRQSNRPTPEVMRDRHPLVVSDVPRPGTQPPLRTESRRLQDIHWNRNWQNDARYDWRRYRHHHGSLFHLGFYYDPFGWGYQPYSIGWRMWPAYYGNQFWIDPGMYGLPYPPPGTRWVRYWNDALLVDTWSGEVIDEIPGFFW